MDLLQDLLQSAGLRRRLIDFSSLAEGGAMRFPCERSIGLHAVTQGTVWLHAPGLPEPLPLHAGDVAVMARGCTHAVATSPGPVPADVPLPLGHFAGPRTDAALAAARLVSGAYQLWHDPLHPFLRSLPAWTVLRAQDLPRLAPMTLAVGLLDGEARSGGLGATTVVHGLLDALFTYALREIAEREGLAQPGWAQAVRDPQVRAALTALHADLARPWTLDTLAREAGLSRTALAERFRHTMGDTPLNHLRTLRMQRAQQLLSETPQTLEQVARAVGYQDAFGFSKVFKRSTGLAPREFRQRDAATRHSPWRLQATGGVAG